MMKLIFILLIGYGAWSYYGGNINASQIPPATHQVIIPTTQQERMTNTPSFSCDGRQHCSQMSSYEEAVFFINNCPNTKMDSDHDGRPCERQFGY